MVALPTCKKMKILFFVLADLFRTHKSVAPQTLASAGAVQATHPVAGPAQDPSLEQVLLPAL